MAALFSIGLNDEPQSGSFSGGSIDNGGTKEKKQQKRQQEEQEEQGGGVGEADMPEVVPQRIGSLNRRASERRQSFSGRHWALPFDATADAPLEGAPQERRNNGAAGPGEGAEGGGPLRPDLRPHLIYWQTSLLPTKFLAQRTHVPGRKSPTQAAGFA